MLGLADAIESGELEQEARQVLVGMGEARQVLMELGADRGPQTAPTWGEATKGRWGPRSVTVSRASVRTKQA